MWDEIGVFWEVFWEVDYTFDRDLVREIWKIKWNKLWSFGNNIKISEIKLLTTQRYEANGKI